jgi:exodeoxyribonuclease-3
MISFGTEFHICFEGRNIRVDFDEMSVMSLYLPSGTNSERLNHYVYGRFPELYNRIKSNDSNLVICGDYNICHEAIDIHDPIRNKKSLDFTGGEGLADTFRKWFYR